MKKFTFLFRAASLMLLFSIFGSFSVNARESVNPVVSPADPPTLTAVTIAPVCVGKKANVILTGLTPSSTGFATYKVNGYTNIASGTADGNGTFSFQTPIALTMAENGFVVEITKIKNTGTGQESSFTGKTATIIVSAYPTLTGIEVGAVCADTPATIFLTGLVPNSAGTAYYKIGNFAGSQYGVADQNGNFSFVTQSIPLSLNNQVIEIKKIINSTGCETQFVGKTATLSVKSKPTLSGVMAAAVCAGNSTNVILSGLTPNSSGTATYNFGNQTATFSGNSDGNGDFSFTTPVLEATANGTLIEITKIASDNGCETNFTTNNKVTLIVNSLPAIEILGSQIVCQGSSFSLTATGGTSYSWKGAVGSNNGITAGKYSSTNPTISRSINGPGQFHRIGDYTVTVEDSNGCKNTATATVTLSPVFTVNTLPVLPAVCEGSDFTINSVVTVNNVTRTNSFPYFTVAAGDPNSLTYNWTGPNFSSSSSNAVVNGATTENAGLYTLEVTGPGGCSKTATRNINVNPLPTIELAETAAVCFNSDITLTASSNGTVLSWFRNGSLVGLGSSFTISSAQIEDGGLYTFRARNNSFCVAEKTIELTVNPLPIVNASSNSPVCDGANLNLSSSGGTSYMWSGPNSFESFDHNPSFNANVGASGTYVVTATDENGCINTANTEVIVNPLPVLEILGSQIVCQGSSFSLTATGGTSYSWKGAVGSNNGITAGKYSSTNPTISRSINGPGQFHRIGDYTVTVEDSNGCKNTATATVTLSPVITVNTLPVLPAVCEGSDFTINSVVTINNVTRTNSFPYFTIGAGDSNSLTYNWTGPNFSSSSSNAVVNGATSDNAGLYTLVVTGPGECSKTATRNITVNPLPTIELAPEASVCEGSEITLNGSSNGTILSWFRNGNLVAVGSSYTISNAQLEDAGSYTFRARNNSFCVAEQTVELTVNKVPTLSEISTAPVCEGSKATIVLSGLLPETAGVATYTVNGLPTQYEASGVTMGDGTFSFETMPLGMAQNNWVIEIIKITNDGTLCESNFSGKTVVLEVNPKPTLTSVETTPVCSGNAATIVLSGLLPQIPGVATYTISGIPGQFQAAGSADSMGNFSFQTEPLPATANGLFIEITKITVDGTLCETNFTGKKVALMVNPSPTLASVTTQPVNAGSKATVLLSGLVKNKNGVAYYTINNLPTQYSAPGLTSASGTYSFQTPVLGPTQNGMTIQIVKITIDGSVCETTFEGMGVTLVVNSFAPKSGDPIEKPNGKSVVENQAKVEFVLYPNPVNDVLNIQTGLDIKTVEILNINGQQVLSSAQKQINVSNLPAGIYMVRIQDVDNNVATKKIIIK